MYALPTETPSSPIAIAGRFDIDNGPDQLSLNTNGS